jgi:hypothetical protein
MPDYPTLADVDSAEALAQYQEQKRAFKQKLKAEGGSFDPADPATTRATWCSRETDFRASQARGPGVCSWRRYSGRMVDLRIRHDRNTRSTRSSSRASTLPQTADGSLGMSNLLTVPRAGNISTDTRAGILGRSGS